MAKYNLLHYFNMTRIVLVSNCDHSRHPETNFTIFAIFVQFWPILPIFGMFLTSYQILMASIVLSGSKMVGIDVYIDCRPLLKIIFNFGVGNEQKCSFWACSSLLRPYLWTGSCSAGQNRWVTTGICFSPNSESTTSFCERFVPTIKRDHAQIERFCLVQSQGAR